MRSTGIKSPQTIAAAFKKLEEVGAIENATFHEGAIIVNTTHLYVPMNVTILRYLLAFNQYLDPSTLITVFAILARLFIFEKGRPVDFTKTTLSKLLGLAKQHIDESGIVLMLAVLEHSGLISLNKVTYTNQLGIECMRYTLVKIDTDGRDIEAYVNSDEEISDYDIQAMWQKILSVQF